MEIFKLKSGFQTSCIVQCTALFSQHRFVCTSNFLDKAMHCLVFINIYLLVFSNWGPCQNNICVLWNRKQTLYTVRSWGITVRSWCDQGGEASFFIGRLILILEEVFHFSFLVWIWKNPLFIKCLWALQQDFCLVPKKSGNLGLSLSLPQFPIWKAWFVQHELSSWLTVSVSEWE